ncbi:MAG: c-type cytochrome [Myxococcota bacterium]
MARETNEILGHGADADGIEEYDNPLPDWWLGLFGLTIVFGIGYAVNYHFISHDSQVSRYDDEMEIAKLKWPVQDGPIAFVTNDALVGEGQKVFKDRCASCHHAELTGGIGPNLVDDEWIHGGEPDQIIATITDGVPEKGMPSWGPVLGPAKVQAVAAFVVSRHGTGGPSTAMAAAPVPAAPTPDGTDAVADEDPAAAGARIYQTNCAACHGPEMKGLVGPNLTDSEWIHGGELDQIIATITNGVPEKGMVSWGPILGAEQIEVVARYVHSQSATPQ